MGNRCIGRIGIEAVEERFGIIRPCNDFWWSDVSTCDRGVPVVVAICAEEGLIDCPSYELLCYVLVAEEMGEGVVLAFGPEGVVELDIGLDCERSGFCYADYHVVVGGVGDRAESRAVFT